MSLNFNVYLLAFQQLSLPLRASEVAFGSEVSAAAEVKFAPRVAQVNSSLGRT